MATSGERRTTQDLGIIVSTSVIILVSMLRTMIVTLVRIAIVQVQVLRREEKVQKPLLSLSNHDLWKKLTHSH